VYKVKLIFSLY